MQSTEEKRNKLKNIFIRCSILLLCVVSLALYFGKYLGLPDWNDVFVSAGLRAEMDKDLSVCFLSVGTADAIYIHQGETDVLIDAGTKKSFTNFISIDFILGIDPILLCFAHHSVGKETFCLLFER